MWSQAGALPAIMAFSCTLEMAMPYRAAFEEVIGRWRNHICADLHPAPCGSGIRGVKNASVRVATARQAGHPDIGRRSRRPFTEKDERAIGSFPAPTFNERADAQAAPFETTGLRPET
jgi:hypothetical protein